MSVPLLGLLLLPLGGLVLLGAPQRLAQLVVFFVPFSATAVLVYHGRESPHWLPVVNWFGILWIVSALPRLLRDGRISLPPYRGRTVVLLAVFVAVAMASLAMPVIIDDRTSIQSARLVDAGLAFPLHFRLNHVLVLWDLVFGTALAVMIARWTAEPEGLERALRAVVWSGLFVGAWGLLEYVSYYLGFAFPYALFSNNPTENPTLTGRVLRGAIEVKRITSVAVEPSVLAQVSLVAMPILLFAMWSDRPLLSRRLDRSAVVLLLATLILSTSVSAYLGLAFLAITIPAGLFLLRRIGVRPAITFLALVGAVAVLYWQSAGVRDFVTTYVLAKPTSQSALERLVTTLNAWGYFLQYPLLGLGWGSVPSTDLVVYLLANTGIAGLVAFLALVTVVVRRLIAAVRGSRADTESQWMTYRVTGVGLALVTILFVSAAARFTYEYAHFWLALGLAIGAPAALRTMREATPRPAAAKPG